MEVGLLEDERPGEVERQSQGRGSGFIKVCEPEVGTLGFADPQSQRRGGVRC